MRTAAAAALAIALLTMPATALADGDPASDVLLSQSSFVPWDSGASARQQQQLDSVLAAAARNGYPIRVAVIASPSDLGSVPALWRRPQTYARFLDEELSLAFHGPVLVVMPNGLGLGSPTGASAGEQGVIARTTRPGKRDLTSAAASAVVQLAASAGHPLPTATPTVGPQSTAPASSQNAVAWIVFVIGAALIALVWGISLRARPPRAFQRLKTP